MSLGKYNSLSHSERQGSHRLYPVRNRFGVNGYRYNLDLDSDQNNYKWSGPY